MYAPRIPNELGIISVDTHFVPEVICEGSQMIGKKLEQSPQFILKQVLDTHKLTRKDHVRLSSFLLSIIALTPAQREQVHHIFDDLSRGKIQLVDELG